MMELQTDPSVTDRDRECTEPKMQQIDETEQVTR